MNTKKIVVNGLHPEYGLHARPATLVCNLATQFEGCEVIAYRDEKCREIVANLKSIMGLMSAVIKNGDTLWIRVNGDIEMNVAANIIAAFLENMHLVIDMTLDAKIDEKEAREKHLIMYDLLRSIVQADSDLPSTRRKTIAASIALVLKLTESQKSAKVDAILNSSKGFHLASASVIVKIASRYKSNIALVFLDKENRAVHCNARDMLELLHAQAADKTIVSIKANGPDCDAACKTIKGVLEHLGDIEKQAREDGAGLNEMDSLWAFLKRRFTQFVDY